MFFLEIENSFDGTVLRSQQAEFPATDKADRETHGMGFANMKNAAEKYHGAVDWDVNGRVFTVSVMLRNEKVMAVTGIGSNYSNGYAGIYAAPAKETAGKEKTKETAAAKREIEIAEKLIEKNRTRAVEKRKKLKEMVAEKRKEIKETAESISEAEAAKEDRQAAKKQSAAKAAGASLDLLV